MRARAGLALELLAALMVTGLVLVTCLDVVGRYLFDSPLGGAFELIEVLLAALVFAALPITTWKGGHVEVDLLLPLLPRGAARALGRLGGAVVAAVLLFFAFRLVLLTEDLLAAGTRTAGLGLALWSLGVLGTLSCIASAVLALVRRPE